MTLGNKLLMRTKTAMNERAADRNAGLWEWRCVQNQRIKGDCCRLGQLWPVRLAAAYEMAHIASESTLLVYLNLMAKATGNNESIIK